MAALEAAARDRDEDSQSPGENNSSKGGKCEVKRESDVKEEDDQTMDGTSNSSGGKNANNESSSNIKTEIKTEPMDTSDNAASGSGNADSVQVKEEIKDEPMSPSNESKTDIKPVVPEPISQNALDKKKKFRKYLRMRHFDFSKRN